MTAAAFYDALAPFYDLIYEDWDASIAYQARALSGVLTAQWPAARSVLDVSCGIGTQAIALALSGTTYARPTFPPRRWSARGAKPRNEALARLSKSLTCANR